MSSEQVFFDYISNSLQQKENSHLDQYKALSDDFSDLISRSQALNLPISIFSSFIHEYKTKQKNSYLIAFIGFGLSSSHSICYHLAKTMQPHVFIPYTLEAFNQLPLSIKLLFNVVLTFDSLKCQLLNIVSSKINLPHFTLSRKFTIKFSQRSILKTQTILIVSKCDRSLVFIHSLLRRIYSEYTFETLIINNETFLDIATYPLIISCPDSLKTHCLKSLKFNSKLITCSYEILHNYLFHTLKHNLSCSIPTP